MDRARIYTPDILVSENTVIVTTNHLGASMETPCGGPFGDSGRDAQSLANISGQRVIGLDRPHMSNSRHYDEVQSEFAQEQPSSVYKIWLDKLQPVLEETGATKVELVGRAIAANFLLEVAVLEELPTTGIVAVDPLALRKSGLFSAALRYGKGIMPSNRAMLRRHISDITRNREYILSDKATMTAALVAARMKKAKTLFAFADKQKAEDRDYLKQIVHSLNTLRSKQNGIAPLLADFAPGTSHRSFSQPDIYTAQYERYRALGRTGDVFTQKIDTIKTDLL